MTEAAATVTTISHEEASRLPEPQWFWRRWLIYGVTVWAMGLLTATVVVVLWVARHPDQPIAVAVLNVLALIIRYSFYSAWAAVILYGVGASVTDLAVLASAVRTTRKETVTSAPQPSAIAAPGAVVRTPAPATVAAAMGPGELPPDQRFQK